MGSVWYSQQNGLMLNFKSIALLLVNVYYIEESVLVTVGEQGRHCKTRATRKKQADILLQKTSSTCLGRKVVALNHTNQKQTEVFQGSKEVCESPEEQTAPFWQKQKILPGGGDGFELYLPGWSLACKVESGEWRRGKA